MRGVSFRFGNTLAVVTSEARHARCEAVQRLNDTDHWIAPMNRIRLKLLIAGTVVAIATTLLALAGVRDGWVYFLPVDQFVDNPHQHTQRVRLHGKVGADHFQENRAGLSASFDLVGKSHTLHVQYTGVIPEMFQADRDVVVEGKLDQAGVFQADTLLTKCASKYESGDGQAPHSDPHLKNADAQRQATGP